MAVIQMNYFSKSLMRTVDVNVILPIDHLDMDTKTYHYKTPFKTLYLLHGIFGDHNDWMYNTNIKRWANDHNLCVVMPSGENMFYVDNKITQKFYGEFVGKELVEMTRQSFPLSCKKEDTFIAGLSMGGYGAIINGIKYHETFGYVAGLSSALLIDNWANVIKPLIHSPNVKAYYDTIFEDVSHIIGSDQDYHALVLKHQDHLPHFYLCVGTEDALLPANREFYQFLKEHHADITYSEGPGAHEWDFWNTYIQKVLDWLPLDDHVNDVSSGNVK